MEKQAKKLLKYISDKKNCPDGYIDFDELYEGYGIESNLPEQQIAAAVRYLEKAGYIRYMKYSTGQTKGVELEHESHHQKAFKFIEFKKYLLHNWIAIAALLISIVSIAMQL